VGRPDSCTGVVVTKVGISQRSQPFALVDLAAAQHLWQSDCQFLRVQFGGARVQGPNNDTGQPRTVARDQRKPDWIYIGSLVLIAISLLGIVYIAWIRYGL